MKHALVRFCFLLSITTVLAGCCGSYPPTGLTPEVGTYSFSQDGSFAVDYVDGELHVLFTTSQAYYTVELNDGAFLGQWGEIGGTHCPTDAFIIRGHFTSPTSAEGEVNYGYACQYGECQYFTAEKEPAQ